MPAAGNAGPAKQRRTVELDLSRKLQTAPSQRDYLRAASMRSSLGAAPSDADSTGAPLRLKTSSIFVAAVSNSSWASQCVPELCRAKARQWEIWSCIDLVHSA